MKFSQSLFLIIIALFTVINAEAARSSSTSTKTKKETTRKTKKTSKRKKRKTSTHRIKFENIKPTRNAELGHSYGEQSYPGKTTFPVNTQSLPTAANSHMGNDW